MLTSKRVTNSLLWGGLAVFLIGIATSCVSCTAGIGGALEGDAGAADAGGTGLAIGVVMLFLGLVAVIVGVIGKAVASARSAD